MIIATFLVGSWALRGPGVAWQPYSDQVLAQAAKEHKPVIIDFYATWCTPCRELDEITFHHPDVVKLADQDFVMVKVDLTQKGNPVHQPPAQPVRRQRRAHRGLSGSARATSARTCGWWIISRRSSCCPAWRQWLRNNSAKEKNHAESQIFPERAQRQTLKAFPRDDAQVGPKVRD